MEDGINDELRRWYAQFHDQHDELRADLMSRLAKENDTLPRTLHSDDLEAYYAQFTQDHDVLRERMLEQLGKTVTPIAATSRREWLLSTVPRLAASVAAAGVGGSLLLSAFSKPLYAIEDVIHRVQSAAKIHLVGTRRVPGQREDTLPFEMYIERPHRFWSTHQTPVISMEKKQIGIMKGHRASDGNIRYLHEDSKEGFIPFYKGPWAEEDLPIWAQIEVESLITDTLGDNSYVSFEDESGFVFIKRTELNGKPADVFERRIGETVVHRLHVNPSTHLPVRAAGVYQPTKGRPERDMWCMTEINLNPQSIPSHVRFKQFDPSEIGALKTPIRRFTQSIIPPLTVPFHMRMGRSCLTCWAANPERVVGTPTLKLMNHRDSEVPCSIRDLGTTFDGVTSWRWHHVELPDELRCPRVAIWYDERNPGQEPRNKEVRRRTPIELGPADISAALKQMAQPDDVRRILNEVNVGESWA